MDAKHYNELIELSQKIYDQSTETVTNYLSNKYCAVGNDTSEAQLEDYLFIAEETSAYFLGNALALLDAGRLGRGDQDLYGKPPPDNQIRTRKGRD